MEKINFLKPSKEKMNLYLYIGVSLVLFSFIDILSNTFLGINLTSFLPNLLSYFSPLIIGVLGLNYIRIEYSGIQILAMLNNIHSIYISV